MKMKKWKVTVKETLERTVEVDAESIEKAVEQVRRDYDNNVIVLDWHDYNGDFDVYKAEEGD